MHSALQGVILPTELVDALDGNLPLAMATTLFNAIRTGSLRVRNKAIALLGRLKGFSATTVARFLCVSCGTILKWDTTFRDGGLDKLFARRLGHEKKEDQSAYRDAVFSILHTPPSAYGINRTSWRMQDILKILREQNRGLSKDGVMRIIRKPGFRFRHAKKVLTITDPEYRKKLEHITGTAAFSHCRFAGGEFMVYPGSVGLTNCLWERVYLTLRHDDDDAEAYLFNNLFYSGTVYYRYRGDNPILQAYDNLFDATTITKGAGSEVFTHDHNAYITNQNRLTPNGANDVILTNSPTYLTSHLGRYYYPDDDGLLSLLLDAGSRNADAAGLYHFTLRPDQTKETTSVVDIGYHYVATNANGQPQDYDGDGVPDYLEDRNGNGTVESGETDWQTATDLGLRVIITEPKRTSNLP